MQTSEKFIQLGYERKIVCDVFYFLERIEYHKPDSHIIFYIKEKRFTIHDDNGNPIMPSSKIFELVNEQAEVFHFWD